MKNTMCQISIKVDYITLGVKNGVGQLLHSTRNWDKWLVYRVSLRCEPPPN